MTGKAANGHFDTHVCLVSQQATPNLTPVLDPEFGPARLVMLVTPDMSQRAQWLESVLRSRTHVKVERIEVTDAWDMHGVLEQLIQWIDQQAPDASIALNVTGGTKPMAMATQQAFAMAGGACGVCRRTHCALARSVQTTAASQTTMHARCDARAHPASAPPQAQPQGEV